MSVVWTNDLNTAPQSLTPNTVLLAFNLETREVVGVQYFPYNDEAIEAETGEKGYWDFSDETLHGIAPDYFADLAGFMWAVIETPEPGA